MNPDQWPVLSPRGCVKEKLFKIAMKAMTSCIYRLVLGIVRGRKCIVPARGYHGHDISGYEGTVSEKNLNSSQILPSYSLTCSDQASDNSRLNDSVLAAVEPSCLVVSFAIFNPGPSHHCRRSNLLVSQQTTSTKEMHWTGKELHSMNHPILAWCNLARGCKFLLAIGFTIHTALEVCRLQLCTRLNNVGLNGLTACCPEQILQAFANSVIAKAEFSVTGHVCWSNDTREHCVAPWTSCGFKLRQKNQIEIRMSDFNLQPVLLNITTCTQS